MIEEEDLRTDDELTRDQRLTVAFGGIAEDLINHPSFPLPARSVVCGLMSAGIGICVRNYGAAAACEYVEGILASLQRVRDRPDNGEVSH